MKRHVPAVRKAAYATFAGAVGVAAFLYSPVAPASAATPSEPFSFLASGFTQTLYGTGTYGIGSVAFAPNGAPILLATGVLFDFSSTTTTTMHGSDVHTFTAYSVSTHGPYFGGATAIVNGENGDLYVNVNVTGIEKITPTGSPVAGPYGPFPAAAGIAVDPQTGDLVYPGGTTTGIAWVNETLTASGIQVPGAYLAPTTGLTSTGDLVFDPSGNYLFASSTSGIDVFRRTGAYVQHIANAAEPNGLDFHAGGPVFLLSNNRNGTMTRYDFPTTDFASAPTQSTFASGGFAGASLRAGPDGCLYVAQTGTRFADGTTATSGDIGSLVQICGGFSFVPPVTTHLSVTAASGDHGDVTVVTGTLTNAATAQGLAGETVGFVLDGTEGCAGTTNGTGVAMCSLTPGQAAGTYALVGSFAGAGPLKPSTGSATFTVLREQTSLRYTGATEAVNGQPLSVAARLTTDDPSATAPLGAERIAFTIGTGGTAQTCHGTTSATGLATCTIGVLSQPPGVEKLTASFSGDPSYLPATVMTSVAVKTATTTLGTPTSSTTLGIGYWRHHLRKAAGLLPQWLGGLEIVVATGSTSNTSVAGVFGDAGHCGVNAADCLAAELLVARLNQARGAPVPDCAATAMIQATSFLLNSDYAGPFPAGDVAYPLTRKQRGTALKLVTLLAAYNSGTQSC
jgi:hypothetical protein